MPLLARIYAARGITHPNQLDNGLNQLLAPALLKGVDGAVARLQQALDQQQRILVVADFDCDGATACAVALRGLAMLGVQHLDYIVPNRFEYGYGLSPEIVAVAATRKPDLIITVDNGIASIEGVTAANQLGIDVLVTDHHLAAAQLPDAIAIVNPNQPGDTFPSKNLAGVGVIFYLLLALRRQLREQQWFVTQQRAEPNLASLLDLVALGTVADVVALDHNNRVLVSQGLARIRSGHCCAGIQAILQVAGRNQSDISSSDLGFMVGPRLNAAGRLDEMSLGIECLLTDDATRAKNIANELDGLNQDRRNIEQGMQQQAMVILNKMELDEALPVGLCLYDESWHQGVVGILASRIKEKLHCPVIAFAPADDGSGQIKGSARSVSGVHIRDVLDAIASRHPGLLNKFGGHAMAAGLTLAAEHFTQFKQLFDQEVQRHLSRDQLRGVIHSDGELAADEFNQATAEQLRHASPWGQAFTEPVFDAVFSLHSRRIVGEKHLKLQLRHAALSQPIDAIAFNKTDHEWPVEVSQVKVAYQLDINEFRGNRSLQLLVRYIEPVKGG
ncbi:MAG: single-stranded-DNA-specific exonuclease RecJ [Gammaproteobacteria bacterium]|nr:single-stranded-DNA-specific exonuclease RecJ [Gammaproteobacteria bacterium]